MSKWFQAFRFRLAAAARVAVGAGPIRSCDECGIEPARKNAIHLGDRCTRVVERALGVSR
jgi:hypothetical protein